MSKIGTGCSPFILPGSNHFCYRFPRSVETVRFVGDLGWRADRFIRLIWSNGSTLEEVARWSVAAVSFFGGNLVLGRTWGSGIFPVVS